MSWEEVPLFELATDVVAVTLRIGRVEDHHLQWQIEIHDPRSQELVGMLSTPHVDPRRNPEWWEQLLGQFEAVVMQHVGR